MGFLENALGTVYNAGKDLVTGTVGNVYHGAGFGKAPNAYDAQKYADTTREQASNVYGAAMKQQQAAAAGPTYSQIVAPSLTATPTAIKAQQIAPPGAITADRIQASDLVAGQAASDLRTQQLSQAETAANSPSSAAALMRKAGAQIERQQAGVAAAARGADRGSARRDLMQNIGTQGMEAAATTSALAAQEQAAKDQAYSAALGNIRSGDVNAAQAQTDVAGRNQAAGLQAQTNTAQLGLNAATANQGADLTAQAQTAQNVLNAGQFQDRLRMEAQEQNAQNALNAYSATQGAQLGYLGAATGATNAGTSGNQVQATYATGQNRLQQEQQQQGAKTVGTALSIPGLSDVQVGSGGGGGGGGGGGKAGAYTAAKSLLGGLF